MITGAADPRALDGQLRSREEALRQVTRDEAAVVLACERLDHARHALGLLHVLAARLAALEADRTDAAVAREARRCARFARGADGARLPLNPKLAAAFCHRLAALACGEGGAVARRGALAAVAPALAPARCLTPAHADSRWPRGPRLRARPALARRPSRASPRRRPPPPRAPRRRPAARRRGRRGAAGAAAARRRRARRAGRGPPPRGRAAYLYCGRRQGRVGALSRGGKRLPALRDRAGGEAQRHRRRGAPQARALRLLAARATRRTRAPPALRADVREPRRAHRGRRVPRPRRRVRRDDDGAALAAALARTRTRWRATATPTSRRASSARAAAAPPKAAWKPTSEFGYLLPRPPRPSTPSIRHRDGNDVVSMPRNLHAIE